MAKTTKTLKRDKNGKFLPQKTRKRGKKRRQSRKRGKKGSRRHSKKGRCSKSGPAALFEFIKCKGSKKKRRRK